jgi:hypothetical protein
MREGVITEMSPIIDRTTTIDGEPELPVAKAAKRMGISRQWCHVLCKRGDIPSRIVDGYRLVPISIGRRKCVSLLRCYCDDDEDRIVDARAALAKARGE